eukprot:SAG31_NODE_816_length_11865_cov_38.805116_9_plen_80_part_00
MAVDSRCPVVVRAPSARPGPMVGAGAAVGGGTSASEAVCGTARASAADRVGAGLATSTGRRMRTHFNDISPYLFGAVLL